MRVDPETLRGCRGLPSPSQMRPPPTVGQGGCLASAPRHHRAPGRPQRSPWQLRPLGASLYPDGGQVHWKLPGMLMQR